MWFWQGQGGEVLIGKDTGNCVSAITPKHVALSPQCPFLDSRERTCLGVLPLEVRTQC